MRVEEIVAIDLIDKNGNAVQRIEVNKDSMFWEMLNCGFGEKKDTKE